MLKRVIKSLVRQVGYDIVKLRTEVEAETAAPLQQSITEVEAETAPPLLPSMFIATQPKSGTAFLGKQIEQRLGFVPALVGVGSYPYNMVDGIWLRDYLLKPCNKYAILHLQPSWMNLLEVCYYMDKIVLHIRDTRATPYSYQAMFIDLSDRNGPVPPDKNPTPNAYLLQGICFDNSKIDRLVKNSLKFIFHETLVWQKGWFDALNIDFNGPQRTPLRFCCPESVRKNTHTLSSRHVTRNDPRFSDFPEHTAKVLLTTYDDLLLNGNDEFFKLIVQFFDIPLDVLQPMGSPPKQGEMHFRSGKRDGWKTDLTKLNKST